MTVMRRTKNRLYTLFTAGCAVAATLTTGACSDDFLDHDPDERVQIVSVEQVMELLGTAYSTSNYGWICEISSDNIVDINAPYMATQSNGTEVKVRFNLNSYGRMDDELFCFEPVRSSTGSDSPSEVWEGAYHAIAVANHALQLLDQFLAKNNGDTTDIMRAAYGEAYLCRAYNHFVLVNIFSMPYRDEELSKQDIGIPYVTEPEDRVLVDYDRSNVTETYRKIEADMQKGLALVTDNFYEKPKWHFNTKAAHAFAARFYLYTRQYQKVVEHANFVLGTDYADLPSRLSDWAKMDDGSNLTDYAEIWQGPNEPNNLLLVATHSRHWRRAVGYRYATAGKALRNIYYHLGPNWNYYCMRAAVVCDHLYWDGNSDHGYKSAKIAERFEYTDKVAGIGYAHIIRREFVANELLLMRAEARLLGNDDVDGCVEDLIAYENARSNFSEKTKQQYITGLRLPLKRSEIEEWYQPELYRDHSNTLQNWDFTQKISPSFVIKPDHFVYMNCINDMRRYETAWTGLRFFDVKRLGYEYSHIHFENSDDMEHEYKLTALDKRRAIELPQEVLLAGLDSSYPKVDRSSDSSDVVVKHNFIKY